MVRALRDDMREGKTVDFLVENGHIKEIAPDEFARRYGRDKVREGTQSAAEGGR